MERDVSTDFEQATAATQNAKNQEGIGFRFTDKNVALRCDDQKERERGATYRTAAVCAARRYRLSASCHWPFCA